MCEFCDLSDVCIAKDQLKAILSVVDAALDGRIQLATAPSMGDPVKGIWNVEWNLLRFVQIKAYDGLGERAPDDVELKGVVYYHGA